MALVRRGNVELEINDAFLNSYLAKGYDRIDNAGNVISKGTPNEMNSLKLAYTESLNTISKLTKENTILNEKVQGLQAQVQELDKKLKTKPKSDK